MDDVRALNDEIADLEARLERLERTLDDARAGAVAEDPGARRSSRRTLIAAAGASAVGAAFALAPGGRAVAADPNDVVKDADNTVAATTSLTGGKFRVRDTGGTKIVGFDGVISAVGNATDTFNALVASAKRPNGHGIIAMADRSGGARSQLLLEANGGPPPSASGHRKGELSVDSDGTLWFTTEVDGAIVFREVCGPTTAGAFHPIPPVRVYDSRVAAIPDSGIFGPNSNRAIPVKDGFDLAGAVTAPDAVPMGATAIAFNVTVTATTGPNFVAVVPGDEASSTTSSINWTSVGQSVANGLIVGIDTDRQVNVLCGEGPGSAHVILDVAGYFK